MASIFIGVVSSGGALVALAALWGAWRGVREHDARVAARTQAAQQRRERDRQWSLEAQARAQRNDE